jgi:hypothetical protein
MAKRWRKAVGSLTPKAVAALVIPDVVDDCISFLLLAIDHGLIRPSFTTSDGKVVDLTTAGLGELCGFYGGSPSWRADYSRERLLDDYSDL